MCPNTSTSTMHPFYLETNGMAFSRPTLSHPSLWRSRLRDVAMWKPPPPKKTLRAASGGQCATNKVMDHTLSNGVEDVCMVTWCHGTDMKGGDWVEHTSSPSDLTPVDKNYVRNDILGGKTRTIHLSYTLVSASWLPFGDFATFVPVQYVSLPRCHLSSTTICGCQTQVA